MSLLSEANAPDLKKTMEENDKTLQGLIPKAQEFFEARIQMSVPAAQLVVCA